METVSTQSLSSLELRHDARVVMCCRLKQSVIVRKQDFGRRACVSVDMVD